MKRVLLATSILVCGAAFIAWGQPISSGAFSALVQLWDGTNKTTVKAASTAPTSSDTALVVALSPNGVISGSDSGPVVASATPANSSHAAGVSVGGLFTVALARTNGGSGIITNLLWKSTGGATTSFVARIWAKNPTNSTCTDNTAFAGSDTDDANLITAPFTFTPAAPLNTTGDSATYATVAGISWDYKNLDTSPGQNLYVCIVTNSTDTADENKTVRVTLSGPQN